MLKDIIKGEQKLLDQYKINLDWSKSRVKILKSFKPLNRNLLKTLEENLLSPEFVLLQSDFIDTFKEVEYGRQGNSYFNFHFRTRIGTYNFSGEERFSFLQRNDDKTTCYPEMNEAMLGLKWYLYREVGMLVSGLQVYFSTEAYDEVNKIFYYQMFTAKVLDLERINLVKKDLDKLVLMKFDLDKIKKYLKRTSKT